MCTDAENVFHARTAVLTDVGQVDVSSFLTDVHRIYDHFICAYSVDCVATFAVCLLATWVVHDLQPLCMLLCLYVAGQVRRSLFGYVSSLLSRLHTSCRQVQMNIKMSNGARRIYPSTPLNLHDDRHTHSALRQISLSPCLSPYQCDQVCWLADAL